ncbi:hypothetical protein GS501_02570 [Saccharibacter sp. 17.LH.SD]|nr:hypothetical protein [Saccharibacter sp. 17.LH.SD]
MTHASFDERLIRGNSFEHRLSRAISVSLDECSFSRAEVAERMGDVMGIRISENVLNAYASPARERHQISVPRFDALMNVTGDRRLLEFLCMSRGLAVIDRRYLPVVELAYLDAHQHDVARRKRALQRSMMLGR